MKIEAYNINDTKIAEVTSDQTIINTIEDGLDLSIKANISTLLIQRQMQ